MSKCTRCDSELKEKEVLKTETEWWGGYNFYLVYVCLKKSCPNYGNLTFASKE